MAAAVVEIGCLFASFFYRINNLFGDTGFRSSIISLNSKSEICISPLTNICAANGKTVMRRYQSKVALIDWFYNPNFISFSIWEISMLESV
jgi:hypothetical protein